MVKKVSEISEDGCIISDSENMNFDDALQYTGYGRYNIILTLICGLIIFISNVEAYSVGYILPMVGCDMELDTYYKGLFASANFIGLTISCPIWGYISDRKGRKRILIICLLLSYVSSFIAPFMTSFWGVAIARFFNGVFISGPSAIIFSYFGEFQTEKNKQKAMPVFCLFIAIALLYLPGLNWFLVSNDIRINIASLRMNHWRLYLLFSSIPNLIAGLLLFKFPESPMYLYHQQKTNESLQILKRMYAINTRKSEDSFPVRSLNEKIFLQKPQAEKDETNHVFYQFKILLKNPCLIYLMATTFTQAVNFGISSGLFLWYPDIMNRLASFNDTKSQLTVCSSLQAFGQRNADECIFEDGGFIQSLAVGGAYVGGYILWGIIVALLGNRAFFMFSMASAALSSIALCFVNQTLVINIMFIVSMVLPGICVSVINSMALDLFPTRVSSMALCLIMTTGRLGSVIASSVVGLSLEWNCVATFLFYAASLAVLKYCSHLWKATSKTTFANTDSLRERAIKLMVDSFLVMSLPSLFHRLAVGDLGLFYSKLYFGFHDPKRAQYEKFTVSDLSRSRKRESDH